MTRRHEIRVYFEDTDFSGRVYHGAFVRFLERGRTEALRSGGIDHRTLERREPPLWFTLRGLSMTFHGPAFIDDLLVVETTPAEGGRASLLLGQRILRQDTPIVTARVELCLIDREGRPRRPPDDIRTAIGPPPTC
jgi:acyl-CoA thioester hydrolase